MSRAEVDVHLLLLVFLLGATLQDTSHEGIIDVVVASNLATQRR